MIELLQTFARVIAGLLFVHATVYALTGTSLITGEVTNFRAMVIGILHLFVFAIAFVDTEAA